MKELDLTMVNMANMSNKKGRKLINEQARKEALKETDRVLSTINQAQREKAIHNFCKNSIQDQNHSKRKLIHGKTYVGKEAVYVALAVAAVILTAKGTEITSEILEYNRVLDQKIESELTNSEKNLYQAEHKNPILNAIDTYQQIQEGKEGLNSKHYNFFGENIQDNSKEYLPFDGRSFFNLSEYSQDAIDIATDQVVSEYQERGK